MTFKEKSLVHLSSIGLNVHRYSMISTFEELEDYQSKNDNFSVRFDSEKPRNDLPFYTYDILGYSDGRKYCKTGKSIVQLAKSMKCKLLCADGSKYDKEQICNYVYRMDAFKDYVLELSFKNGPLRRMYDGTTIIIKGNLYSEDFEISGDKEQRRFLSTALVSSILDDVFKNSVHNKWCECTIYPQPVGLLNSNIIYWQVI